MSKFPILLNRCGAKSSMVQTSSTQVFEQNTAKDNKTRHMILCEKVESLQILFFVLYTKTHLLNLFVFFFLIWGNHFFSQYDTSRESFLEQLDTFVIWDVSSSVGFFNWIFGFFKLFLVHFKFIARPICSFYFQRSAKAAARNR